MVYSPHILLFPFLIFVLLHFSFKYTDVLRWTVIPAFKIEDIGETDGSLPAHLPRGLE